MEYGVNIFGIILALIIIPLFLGLIFDRTKEDKKFAYIVLATLIVLFNFTVYKVDTKNYRVVKKISYDRIIKSDDTYILKSYHTDDFGVGYVSTIRTGMAGIGEVVKTSNSPKGNYYEKKCYFSSHWLGWYDSGYNKNCVEYLHKK